MRMLVPLIVINSCMKCRHFHIDDKKVFSCDAFKKIPKEILLGENDHKKPYSGDRGIQFEPKQ